MLLPAHETVEKATAGLSHAYESKQNSGSNTRCLLAALVSLVAVLIAGAVTDGTGPPDHTPPARAVDTPPTIDGPLRGPAWTKVRAATRRQRREVPFQRIEADWFEGSIDSLTTA